MQELKNKIASTAEHVEDYLKVEEQLLRLRIVRSASKSLAFGISLIILIISGFIALIFLSLGIAWLINEKSGNDYIGHVIVGGSYLLLGLVAWFGREKILLGPVVNKLIHAMLEEDKDDDDDGRVQKS